MEVGSQIGQNVPGNAALVLIPAPQCQRISASYGRVEGEPQPEILRETIPAYFADLLQGCDELLLITWVSLSDTTARRISFKVAVPTDGTRLTDGT